MYTHFYTPILRLTGFPEADVKSLEAGLIRIADDGRVPAFAEREIDAVVEMLQRHAPIAVSSKKQDGLNLKDVLVLLDEYEKSGHFRIHYTRMSLCKHLMACAQLSFANEHLAVIELACAAAFLTNEDDISWKIFHAIEKAILPSGTMQSVIDLNQIAQEGVTYVDRFREVFSARFGYDDAAIDTLLKTSDYNWSHIPKTS